MAKEEVITRKSVIKGVGTCFGGKPGSRTLLSEFLVNHLRESWQIWPGALLRALAPARIAHKSL